MKIDTQGMTLPLDPNYKGKPLKEQQDNLPKAIITPKRLFTESYVKEMKILINEVLDEREYKKQLSQAVDNPTPPGVSYFDVDKFKHCIDDPEPDYPLESK
jgi:hypothetical protein|tara:strand:+ start:3428 stop:3730 length:303 start_codon:yes stop_codon:yes gene_type:complete